MCGPQTLNFVSMRPSMLKMLDDTNVDYILMWLTYNIWIPSTEEVIPKNNKPNGI
jgi:hypothetical protein